MKNAVLLFIFILLGCSSEDLDTPNMCVDETLINLDTVCPAVVEPVCGCDGNTYNNACEAFNWNGVKAYSNGACP
jgi:hypothetical protein